MTPPIRHIDPILQVLLSSIPVFAALPLSPLNLLLSDGIAPGSQCRIVHLHCQQNMTKEDQRFSMALQEACMSRQHLACARRSVYEMIAPFFIEPATSTTTPPHGTNVEITRLSIGRQFQFHNYYRSTLQTVQRRNLGGYHHHCYHCQTINASAIR